MPISISPDAPMADTLRRLQASDPNLSKEGIPYTMEYCKVAFKEATPIQDRLFGEMNLADDVRDFELKEGIRSLIRRGFYQIIDQPFARIITSPTGIKTPIWIANVLFTDGNHPTRYYRFVANVEPMLNVNAMGFNFSSYGPTIISGNNLHVSKADFFINMIDKVFYVSQQMYVDDDSNKPKQTVWFKFI